MLYCDTCLVDGIKTNLHNGACWKHGTPFTFTVENLKNARLLEPGWYPVSKLAKKDIHKFYLGARHIANAIAFGSNDAHTHKTFDGAVTQAQNYLNEHPSDDSVIIVKIVAIVRRKEAPVIVEKL